MSKAKSASDIQAAQLARLLKDPSKPAYVPAPPEAKTIRAPKDMMKNVQGSSAGAGSGEFHVYKQSRRREFERIKMMEDEDASEKAEREGREKKEAADAILQAKADKNRDKRLKRKAVRKSHKSNTASNNTTNGDATNGDKRKANEEEVEDDFVDQAQFKKRKMVPSSAALASTSASVDDGQGQIGAIEDDQDEEREEPRAAVERGIQIHDDDL